jgi:AraC-like DNA-binding protein
MVCKVVDQRLADRSLDSQSLAHATYLSRSTLYRLLAPFGGVGPFIIRRRLEAARAILIAGGPGTTLSELADQVGFASASHLSRAFLDHFGERPGEFRKTARNRGTLG